MTEKESGMNKLEQLLIQFEENKKNAYYIWRIEGEDIIGENIILGGDEQIDTGYLIICSKRYGFIKWLVDNDKIDYEPIMKKEIGYWSEVEGVRGYETYNLENTLLMLLSISDTPIDFLVSILKD